MRIFYRRQNFRERDQSAWRIVRVDKFKGLTHILAGLSIVVMLYGLRHVVERCYLHGDRLVVHDGRLDEAYNRHLLVALSAVGPGLRIIIARPSMFIFFKGQGFVNEGYHAVVVARSLYQRCIIPIPVGGIRLYISYQRVDILSRHLRIFIFTRFAFKKGVATF